MKLKQLGRYSVIGWSNRLLLQWFFMRIEASIEDDRTINYLNICFPVLPGTGWWGKRLFPYYIPQKFGRLRVYNG